MSEIKTLKENLVYGKSNVVYGNNIQNIKSKRHL